MKMVIQKSVAQGQPSGTTALQNLEGPWQEIVQELPSGKTLFPQSSKRSAFHKFKAIRQVITHRIIMHRIPELKVNENHYNQHM